MQWLYVAVCVLYGISGLLGVLRVALPARRRPRVPPKLFAFTGFALHTAYVIAYGVQHGRHPWATPHEMLGFLVWAGMLVYLIADTVRPVPAFSAFFVPAAALLAIGAAWLELGGETAAAPGVWVKVHGMSAMLGLGAFALGAAAAVMYLVQDRQLRAKHPGRLFAALPSLDVLDRTNSVCVGAGFALFTIALFSGTALMSALKAADDIRSAWLLLAASSVGWAVFGAVLYCRLTGTFRGRKIAWLTLAGLALIAIALAAILLADESIHAFGAKRTSACAPPGCTAPRSC